MRFAQAWHAAVRSHEPIGLALIDVDAFKAYNDRYGHQAGDSCLRTVGQALGGALWRRTDLAARYGGEEFAVVLPSTTLDGAFRAAQRIRATVEALAIPHDASPVHSTVTVSIGVAGCTPRGGDDLGELIAAADAALYEAKRNGRNQSRMADLPRAARATAP
jgi:diguanylate cyclase (GGDEF)-like protein